MLNDKKIYDRAADNISGSVSAHKCNHKFCALQLSKVLGYEPSAEQTEIIEADYNSNILVKAGAGSGKTETITNRIIWLIANKYVKPNEILGLTFTNKAVSELSDRVLTRLKQFGFTVEQGMYPTVKNYNSFAVSIVEEFGMYLGIDDNVRVMNEADTYITAKEVFLENFEKQLSAERAEAGNNSEGNAGGARAKDNSGNATGLDAKDNPNDNAGDPNTDAVSALYNLSLENIIDEIVRLEAQISDNLIEYDEVEKRTDESIQNISDKIELAETTAERQNWQSILEKMRLRKIYIPYAKKFREKKKEIQCITFSDQIAYAYAIACDERLELAKKMSERYKIVFLDEYQDTSAAQALLLQKLFIGDYNSRVAERHVLADSKTDSNFKNVSSVAFSNKNNMFAPPSITAVGDANQAIYTWRGAFPDTIDNFHKVFHVNNRNEITKTLTVTRRNDKSILNVANKIIEPLEKSKDVPFYLSSYEGAQEGNCRVVSCENYKAEQKEITDFVKDKYARGKTVAVLSPVSKDFPVFKKILEAEGIPVEIVGMGGLLQNPEIEDVVALMNVCADDTKTDMLMRLLVSPLINLGPKDLLMLAGLLKKAQRGELERSAMPADAVSEGVSATDAATPGRISFDTESSGTVPLEESPSGEKNAITHSPRENITLATLIKEYLKDEQSVEFVRSLGYGDAQYDKAFEKIRLLNGIIRRTNEHARYGVSKFATKAIRELNLFQESEVLESIAHASNRKNNLKVFIKQAVSYEETSVDPTVKGFLNWLEISKEEKAKNEIPVADINKNVVQLVTVHGAKGLEWDCVACCCNSFHQYFAKVRSATLDSYLNKNGDWGYLHSSSKLGGNMILSFDFMKSKEFDIADAGINYSDVVEYKKRVASDTYKEKRRLAYVAYTRAKHDLLITSTPYIRGRKAVDSPTSFFYDALEIVEGEQAKQDLEKHIESLKSLKENKMPYKAPSVFSHPHNAKNREGAGAEYYTWPVRPEDNSNYAKVVKSANLVRENRHDMSLEEFVKKTEEKFGKRAGTLASAESSQKAEVTTENLQKAETKHDKATVGDLNNSSDFNNSAAGIRAILSTNLELLLKQKEKDSKENISNVAEDGIRITPTLAVKLFRQKSSNSQPKSETDCDSELRYKKNMLRPIPMIFDDESEKQKAGNIMHEFIESYYLENELNGEAKPEFIQSFKEKHSGEFDEGNEVLSACLENFFATDYAKLNPFSVEQKFDFVCKNHIFIGKTDVVFESDEGKHIKIVDWKTGKKPEDEKEERIRALQLAIYCQACSRIYKIDLKNIDASFVYLHEGSESEYTSEELQEIFDEFTGMM